MQSKRWSEAPDFGPLLTLCLPLLVPNRMVQRLLEMHSNIATSSPYELSEELEFRNLDV